jgi:2-oxoisovalerate dehydrogenase E2 component (dihydrolipoyl transacylase)
MTLPDLGEGIVEAELTAWLVGVGDDVTPESPIAEVLTDKATVEVCAPVRGTVAELLAEEGSIVTVGTAIVAIEQVAAADAPSVGPVDQAARADGEPRRSSPPSATTGTSPAGDASDRPVLAADGDPPVRRPSLRALAAPTVRRRAKEMNVDLSSLVGTGPNGRIVMSDLDAAGGLVVCEQPQRRQTTTEPVRGLRRTIARRLTVAWQAPHITYVEQVDVTELERLRTAINGELEGGQQRLTLLPFIGRAVVRACADHPRMNATYDAEAGQLQLHGPVHLGIAAQTDRGLLVPVVRDAGRRSLSSLAAEIDTLARAARDATIGPQALAGSTITISSLGALGGIVNTPILNAPEVAIVGVNKIQVLPMWDGSGFVPRSVMNLSASFDHRVIDGWDGAVFVQRIKQLLESPALLTLGWER